MKYDRWKISCSRHWSYLDGDDSISVLYSVRGSNLQPVGVPRLPVQGFPEAQHPGVRGVQLKVTVVPLHQAVRQMSQGVRVAGPKCGHHLSSRQVLRHRELDRSVAERRRTVVSVEDGDPHLRKRRTSRLVPTKRTHKRSWRWFSRSTPTVQWRQPATGACPNTEECNLHPTTTFP